MLITFCNSNQLLAAINVVENTLSLYYNPQATDLERNAFDLFIQDHFKIVTRSPRSTDYAHVDNYHLESSHLTNLRHSHFDFGNVLEQNTVSQFISAVKSYQDKDKPILRDKFKQKVLSYMTGNSWSLAGWLESLVETSLDYLGFKTGDQVANLPVLSSKNLNRLNKLIKKDGTFSSGIIINLLNTTSPDRYYTPLPQAGVITTQNLIDSTCSDINAIARAEDQRLLAGTVLVSSAFAISATLAIGFWLRRELQAKPARQQPLVAPNTAAQVSTSTLHS